MEDPPRTSTDTGDGDEVSVLLDRSRLRSFSDVLNERKKSAAALQEADEPPGMTPAAADHSPLEARPSTTPSVQSTVSTFRALVRTMTPKRRPRPILVKAGVRRDTAGTGDEEDRDLRVTFDLPRVSVGSATDSSAKMPRKSLRRLKALTSCCDRPLVTVSGILALIGGMSFGYDMGIVSGVMQPIRDHFDLTCGQELVLVGCMIGGALIVSICGGQWIDKCGRRRAILISATVFILGSGLSAIAGSLDALSAGRLLQGFGMSLAALSECIYISEIAPKGKRGFMVGLTELGIALGFVSAFLCGYILHGVKDSWRIMMGIGTIPAGIQFVGTFFFLPPSPREKMMYRSDREAILILDNLRGNRNEAMNEFVSIRHTQMTEEAYGTLSLFRSRDNLLFRLLVGLSLVLLQQLSGQANVLYYASVIFEQVGFSVRWASLATLCLGIVKVIATAVVICLTDKKGRRFFLVLGCLLMAASMALVGLSTVIRPPVISKVCLRNLDELHPVSQATRALAVPVRVSSGNFSNLPADAAATGMDGALTAQLAVNFLALVVYVVGYSIGFGPMTWLVMTEIFPAGVKGRAMSFCNLISWTASLAMSLSFLHTIHALSIGGTFLVFAVLNLFSALYIFLVVPETEGKSLEKVSYEIRTMRPKQRFDGNLQKLCPCLKSRLNRTTTPGQDYSRPDRDALI